MAFKKVTAFPQFTDADLRILFLLVRGAATDLGYGDKYDNDNKYIWPTRLKNLTRVARKIQAQRKMLKPPPPPCY
jgi:hypothetical protein